MKKTKDKIIGKRIPSFLRQYAQILAAMAIAACLSNIAYASNTPMGNVLCTTSGWFTGNLGIGLEMITICIIGVLALNNKITWGMALLHGIGIAVVFHAASLVEKLVTNAPSC